METIGKYRIIGELGEGGFGHVYKAEDPAIGNVVAIKVLNVQNDESMIRRFRAEAVTSAQLRHKNIITIFDFDEQNGMPYLVMEYLDGKNLQHFVHNRNAVPLIDKLTIMAEVADGLQYAHERGVIHRDIKPANIMRLSDGSVKIMDFGIARFTQRNTALTAIGYMVGTPEYMAPEQFMGGATDQQVDIWAYGVVFYEFLTGRNPFAGETPGVTMYRVTHEDPPAVWEKAPELPRSLDPILKRLLAKKKTDRYPSLDDMRVDLSMVIQDFGEAQVEGMEKDAEALIQAGRYEEALGVAAGILRFDHRNLKARKWRSELRDLTRRQKLESRIKVLIDEADQKTTAADFPTAESRLQEALQIDPDNMAARSRLVQIHEVREKKARAERLLVEARVEWQRQNYTSAFANASEAVQDDPANPDAVELLNQIRQAIEQQNAGRRQSALSRARGQVLVQDYDGAVLTLQELDRQYPGDAEVRARIEEAQRLQAAGATEKKVTATVSLSRDYLSKGAIQEAIDLLSGLEPEAGRNAQVSQLLSFAREQRERQQREAEFEKLMSDAASAAGGNDTDRALAYIARALELSPANDRALRLQGAVVASRQREQPANTIDGELQQCRDLMDEGRLELAETRARQLWKRNPENPEVQRIVRDLGERLRRTVVTRLQVPENMAAARKEAYMEGRREVVELMKNHRIDDAITRLQQLAVAFPDEPQVQNDLRRAMAHRDEVARKAAFAKERESLQGLVTSREFEQAVYKTQELLAIFPQEPELVDLLDKARQARDRAARKEAYAQRRTEFEELLRNRDFGRAVMAVERLMIDFPEEQELHEDLRRARLARDQG
ncbi:MAG TPA: protein kinase [Bryobacteraceae bacterium]|jgi:predicted Ser/Thr protein kinase|nr:protein kinase [Bryobacteraceae bacterium]